MKSFLAAPAFALLLSLSVSSAAVVLNDFTAFETSGAYDSPAFLDSWIDQGEQESDGYAINGALANNGRDSGVDFYFAEPTDFAGQSSLSLSVKLLDGNETTSFAFKLFDSNGLFAIATFQTSWFATDSYTTVIQPFDFAVGFDASSVEQWTLTGDTPFGADRFAISFQSAVAVPEPYTCVLLAVAALIVFFRRRAGLMATN